jgi:hypothetical protein
MKRAVLFAGTVMAFIVAIAGQSFAQRGMNWRGGGGWGPGSPYNRMFDPKTVETVSGEVVSIDKITPMRGMSYGIHLMLKTDNGTISVHLGPGWYIENQDVKLAVKDRIEVKGSRITFDGKPAIIAMEIKKGGETLTLRDADGFPLWAGWRRK